jgi:hypothetical protein
MILYEGEGRVRELHNGKCALRCFQQLRGRKTSLVEIDTTNNEVSRLRLPRGDRYKLACRQ